VSGSDPRADEAAGTARESATVQSDSAAAGAPAVAPLSADAIPSVARPYRLQFEEAQDAWVLLYPEGMIKLNRSAGETLARCDGERRVGEIVTLLEEAFGQPGLGADVRGFLGLALAQRWIELR